MFGRQLLGDCGRSRILAFCDQQNSRSGDPIALPSVLYSIGWSRSRSGWGIPTDGVEQDAGEQDEEHDDGGHTFTASARAWCSRMRQDGPLMLNTTARCMRRSKMAAATTASPKTSPHEGKPLLLVASVGWPFS